MEGGGGGVAGGGVVRGGKCDVRGAAQCGTLACTYIYIRIHTYTYIYIHPVINTVNLKSVESLAVYAWGWHVERFW